MSIAIASIGELLVEFVCADKDGHHRRMGQYSGPYPSGAPGIFIDQAARCGARSIFVGSVGADAFGDVIRNRLRADGVDDRLVSIDPRLPTGSAFVSYNSDGSRDFVYNIGHSAAAQFEADDVVVKALADFGTKIIHVSGSALADPGIAAKILHICEALLAKGVRISFDPNIRKELLGDPSYMTIVRRLLATCTFFLPSDDDAVTLFGDEPFESYAARLVADGIDCVVLKRGDIGASCYGRDGMRHDVAAHKVEVADPTGAGDCFCATFVTLYGGGSMDAAEALRFANAAGALAVGKVGPMEGNSSLATIRAFLEGRGQPVRLSQ